MFSFSGLLERHKEWNHTNGKSGSKANLCCYDLRNESLLGCDLSGACLSGSDFRCVDMRYADLSNANLCDSNLCGADLRGANLRGADLRGANIRDAKLPSNTFIILGEEFYVQISNGDTIRVGCQSHSVDKWRRFGDSEILSMGNEKALNCYPRLLEIINFYIRDADSNPKK